MSKAASSPTGRLLRSSRLFSLPRPLPSPQLEKPSAQGQYRASDTATLPYPTHQAITTPASSNFRGDWGLKRPLPARATRRTSTPIIRVHAQDTYEHITDFSSAADHVLNQRKWAEMAVPMMYRPKRSVGRGSSGSQHFSAYEEWLDNTTMEASTGDENGDGDVQIAGLASALTAGKPFRPAIHALRQRWKSEGPWIAGMQEGEFSVWLKNVLAKAEKTSEWITFVCDRIMEKRLASAQRRARDEGEVIGAEEGQRLRVLLRPTLSECKDIMKTMREEYETQGLSSDLTALICDFLDLPSVKTSAEETIGQDSLVTFLADSVGAGDSDRGPPSTHLGAGLSYIRTSAYMENHPIHGPQAYRSPVLARVLRTRTSSAGGTEYKATLGVGGVVTADPFSGTYTADRVRRDRQEHTPDALTQSLDPDIEGGNKIWVHPELATVNEDGRIDLRVSRGDSEAIAVRTGNVQHIHEAKTAGSFGGKASTLPRLTRFMTGAPPTQARSSSVAPAPGTRLPGVTGFDEDSGAPPLGELGQRDGEARMRNIIERGRWE